MSKRQTTTGAQSDTLPPPTGDPAAKRTRAKADYLIQRWVEGTADRGGFWDDLAADEVPEQAVEFDDTAAALAYVRSNRVVGRLRIIAVKRELTTVEEQTTTFKVT